MPSDALNALVAMDLKCGGTTFTDIYRAKQKIRASFKTFKKKKKKIQPLETAMLTSKLLLPVAGNFTLLSLGGLLALRPSAGALACSQAAVPIGGHADTPLPFPTVRLLRLFL